MNEFMNERMNDMKKIVMILMAAVLIALPAMAQFGSLEQPNAVFQSTSTLSPSGSAYSSNPTLDDNGTASAPNRAPRRSSMFPPTPEIDPNDSGNTPIGDATLPLLLFAAAFAATVAIRNRRRQVAE